MTGKRLSIFSAPKPFKDDHIITIQRNAIKSWKALGDAVEVLLLGADEGIDRHAADLGVVHFSDVRCNPQGTPLISSMLQIARESSRAPFMVIVNADIIFFPDLLDSIRAVSQALEKFVIIGQRWDMDIRAELEFSQGQFAVLREKVFKEGQLHPPMGSDYFIFPRACYRDIPDLAIGRAGWDNWFIFKSRFEGWPLIDATRDITIVHQSHDYRHLPGGQPHYRLPETHENVRLGGGEHTIFTIFDAQYWLSDGKIVKKKIDRKKITRELEISPLTLLRSHFLGKLMFYFFRPKKAYRDLRKALNQKQA